MRRYSSGDWYALVTNQGVAMLPNTVPPELVESVWLALGDGGGLTAVLEGIVGGFGTSLSSLPPFAVVSRTAESDEIRVAVRGPLQVQAEVADGLVTVAGMGVSTWNEDVLTCVDSFGVGISGSGPARLPINEGAVLAAWVTFAEGMAVAPPAMVPVVQQESEPEEPGSELPEEPEVFEEPETFLELARSGETTIQPLDEETPESHAVETPAIDEDSAAIEDYDRLLYGDTTRRSVEGAAVRHDAIDEAPVTPSGPALISGLPQFAPASIPEQDDAFELGDHDGRTISTAKLRALQAQGGIPAGASAGVSGVPALNAPATLVVSTGQRLALDRGAVVGRRPQLARVQGGSVPHLVTVPSPSQDISRSHVELRVVGQDLLAVDLNTTNGTRLLRPGSDPIRLQPGDPTILVDGDRLDLGDGVELRFEGLR